jgi:hypothetical protein
MRRAAWIALAGLAALSGCDENNLARVGLRAGWEAVWGGPSEEALARSERFEGAGLAFDYPAALHRRESVDEDGDRTWSFEYGMFELEVYAPTSPIDSALYLSALSDMFQGGRRMDATDPASGRTESLCGQRLTATTLRIKLMDDWSELEAFDLPAPEGEARLLIFDDEPVDGRPSSVARATRERVLATLRCDPGFVRTPVETP